MNATALPREGATMLGRASAAASSRGRRPPRNTPSSAGVLAEVKGQAQFLLYLADQIDESLQQLDHEADPGHTAFLCKILSMYSTQLETKHQGLGDRIAETCQEVYIAVREFDVL